MNIKKTHKHKKNQFEKTYLKKPKNKNKKTLN